MGGMVPDPTLPSKNATPYVREVGYAERYRDRRFETGHGPATHRRERVVLEDFLERIAAGSAGTAIARSLDMPSGTGRMSGLLPGCVVQVDRELSMVAASAVPGPRACASGAALPFADGAFDLALSLRLFQHLPDAHERRAILGELRRVTVGHLVVSYFESRSLQHQRRRMRRRLGKPRSGRCAYPWSAFAADLAFAGWTTVARRPTRRWWSEQVLVLCR